MNFRIWLFAVKKLAATYSGAQEAFEKLSDEEKMSLWKEFYEEG